MDLNLDHHLKALSKENDFEKRLIIYETINQKDFLKFNVGKSETLLKRKFNSLVTIILSDLLLSEDDSVDILLSIANQVMLSSKDRFYVSDDVALDFFQKLFSVTSPQSSVALKKIANLLEVYCFEKKVLEKAVDIFLTNLSLGTSANDAFVYVFNSFMKKCPDQMETSIESWLKALLRLTCHNDAEIRRSAVDSLNENLNMIIQNRKKIVSQCVHLLRETVLPNLKVLCSMHSILHEVLSNQLPIYISIIGEDNKRSSRLSNSLLKFVEKGFCHNEENIKLSAFKVWDCFINCFANHKEVLSSSKYFNLFTQPLKLKLKSETVTKALIETMWKLSIYLDENLKDFFDMLCAPLFGICFKSDFGAMQMRRSSGRLSFSNLQRPYESVQILGAEMLSHLLLSPTIQDHNFALNPLREPFFGVPAIFYRFHATLIPVICNTICQLHHLFSAKFLWNIWEVCLKCVQVYIVRKKDVEIFRSLYTSAHRIVGTKVDPDLLLLIVSSLTSFSSKVLNSSLHYQCIQAGEEAMHGTPVVSVLRLLLSDNVCEDNLKNPKFLECAETIVTCGMQRRIGNLEFIHSVVAQLHDSDEVYLKIWTCLAQEAVTYLEESGNVNDGDSFEHGFSSLYEMLLFPLTFIFSSDSIMSAATAESAWSSWSRLFKSFSACACKIEGVERNETSQHISNKLLLKLNATDYKKMDTAQFKFLEVIIFELFANADFSHYEQNKTRTLKNGSLNFANFSIIAFKIITAIEKIFNESSFPPFNILPCCDVIIRSIDQSLAEQSAIVFSGIFLQYAANFSILTDATTSALQSTWTQLLKRLTFTEALFNDGCLSELFQVILSDPSCPLYTATVSLWQEHAADNIEVTKLPDGLRNAVFEMCKKEGLDSTWDTDFEEDFQLNVSTVSDHSGTTADETDVCNIVVLESDVSDETITPGDVAQDDEDVTQLDKESTLSSDDSYQDEILNRSLNLRTLANNNLVQEDHNRLPKKLIQLPRRSPRFTKLQPPKSTSFNTEVDSVEGHGEAQETSVDEPTDKSLIMVSESQDEISSATDVETSFMSSDMSERLETNKEVKSLHEKDEDKSSDDSELQGDSFYSCNTQADTSSESLYEEVEMVDVSVNVDINSSQDTIVSSQENQTLKRPWVQGTPKGVPTGNKNSISTRDKLNKDTKSDKLGAKPNERDAVPEKQSIKQDKQGTKHDESIIKSIKQGAKSDAQDAKLGELRVTPSNRDTQLDRDSSNCGLDSYVEMVNISTMCDTSERRDTTSDPISVVEVVTVDSDESSFEYVEMAETSMQTEPNPCENTAVANAESTHMKPLNDMLRRSDVIECASLTNDVSKPQCCDELKSKRSESDARVVADEISTEKNKHSIEGISGNANPPVCNELRHKSPVVTLNNLSFSDSKASGDDGYNVNDLGVEPLDSSFETVTESEQILKKPIILPDKNVVLESLEPDGDVVVNENVESIADEYVDRKRPTAVADSELRNSSTTSNDSNCTVASEAFRNHFIINENEEKAAPVAASQTAAGVYDVTTCKETVVDDVIVETAAAGSRRNAGDHEANETNSPQASERPDCENETPRSCLGKRLTIARENHDNASPSESPCGILKKRPSDFLSPATKSRRVSFAEPISTSTSCPPGHTFPSLHSSPRYSSLRKSKSSSRLVSRRLSLPVSHRSYDVTSPMSVRSANVAAVIADIKARNIDSSSSASITSTKSANFDVTSLTLSQLQDVSFLKTLSSQQRDVITQNVLELFSILYAIKF